MEFSNKIIYISGTRKCGKTTFVRKIIDNIIENFSKENIFICTNKIDSSTISCDSENYIFCLEKNIISIDNFSNNNAIEKITSNINKIINDKTGKNYLFVLDDISYNFLELIENNDFFCLKKNCTIIISTSVNVFKYLPKKYYDVSYIFNSLSNDYITSNLELSDDDINELKSLKSSEYIPLKKVYLKNIIG